MPLYQSSFGVFHILWFLKEKSNLETTKQPKIMQLYEFFLTKLYWVHLPDKNTSGFKKDWPKEITRCLLFESLQMYLPQLINDALTVPSFSVQILSQESNAPADTETLQGKTKQFVLNSKDRHPEYPRQTSTDKTIRELH